MPTAAALTRLTAPVAENDRQAELVYYCWSTSAITAPCYIRAKVLNVCCVLRSVAHACLIPRVTVHQKEVRHNSRAWKGAAEGSMYSKSSMNYTCHMFLYPIGLFLYTTRRVEPRQLGTVEVSSTLQCINHGAERNC